MKHHQRIGAAIFKCAYIGLVISPDRLSNDLDALRLKIGNRAVLAAAIDREHLIELIERKLRHVMTAAVKLIQGQETKTDGDFRRSRSRASNRRVVT